MGDRTIGCSGRRTTKVPAYPSLLTKPHSLILDAQSPEPRTLFRPRKPKEGILTLEEKEKRLIKWQEKMYQKKIRINR
jgi:hypothetical protein